MMKQIYPVNGIITVLNTPFSASGSLDISSLERHVQVALNTGVNGFLVPAMASEVSTLTLNERIRIVETVLKTVNGKIPVFAGVSGENINKCRELLKSYLRLGCKEILFQIPFINDLQFKKDFKTLADLGPDVIMLQDWDSEGYGLSDSLILELFNEVEAFKCLKIETTPAGGKYSNILKLTGGNLHVSGGWAVTQMIEGLQRGIHAFMPTGMHYTYTQIYQDYVSGRQQQAKQLFEKILPVIAFSNQHIDISIHFFKRLLCSQQIYSTKYIRKPTICFDKVHQKIASELIERVIQIENKIKTKREYTCN